MKDFEVYLINVGDRSHEFTYDISVLHENIEYFRECYSSGMSAYKELIFLDEFLNEEK